MKMLSRNWMRTIVTNLVRDMFGVCCDLFPRILPVARLFSSHMCIFVCVWVYTVTNVAGLVFNLLAFVNQIFIQWKLSVWLLCNFSLQLWIEKWQWLWRMNRCSERLNKMIWANTHRPTWILRRWIHVNIFRLLTDDFHRASAMKMMVYGCKRKLFCVSNMLFCFFPKSR